MSTITKNHTLSMPMDPSVKTPAQEVFLETVPVEGPQKGLEENSPIPILVIAGPTAVGKTAVSLALADVLEGEVVSCDSMQIYQGMDIGSAKPTLEERGQIPHHLMDMVDPQTPFSAARYRELAMEAIRDIHHRGHVPIVTGGTGLYLNALLYEMDFGPSGRNLDYRKTLEDLAETQGPYALHQRLAEKDPLAAERIHPHNVKRVIRALD